MDDDSALPTGDGMNGILSSDTEKPFLTADLPGTGGRMKSVPEDFYVEERPAFPFSGAGEHLVLQVEKVGMTTHRAAELLERAFGCRPGGIGYAGLKDSFAVSRQFFSLQTPAEDLPPLPPGLRILSKTRHNHKLRAGMLSGNFFRIRIRAPKSPENAAPIMETLAFRGLPNYYGAQRFGSMRNVSARVGFALLRGDFESAAKTYLSFPGESEPEGTRHARRLCAAGDFSAAATQFPPGCFYERRLLFLLSSSKDFETALWKTFPKHLIRLFVSSTQSEVFNKILSKRINSLDTFLEGDVGMFQKGAVFFKNAVPGDPRLGTFEVSPSGVLVGRKAVFAGGAAGEIELGALSECGLAGGELFNSASLPFSLDGSRRRLREKISEVSVSTIPGESSCEDILISFVLPKGTYATEVLREVIKGT